MTFPARPAPAAGSRFGRYRVLSEIGRGATGAVFRAHDSVLRRDVALKLLRHDREEPAREHSSERLLHEGRAAAAINHANAVQVYDVGEHLGIPFLTMELIEGRTLRACLTRGLPALPERVKWLLDVARALHAAHARGLVHRDVKPENIMVARDGALKVLDFGIARRIPRRAPSGAALGTGSWVGTPLYMAPEQIQGGTSDGRSDQFAWGIVAYELLTAQLPWRSPGLRGVSEMLEGQPPVPLRERNREVSAALEAVVLRALSFEREQRFASLAEVIRALGDATEGTTSGSGTFEPVPRDARESERILLSLGATLPETWGTRDSIVPTDAGGGYASRDASSFERPSVRRAPVRSRLTPLVMFGALLVIALVARIDRNPDPARANNAAWSATLPLALHAATPEKPASALNAALLLPVSDSVASPPPVTSALPVTSPSLASRAPEAPAGPARRAPRRARPRSNHTSVAASATASPLVPGPAPSASVDPFADQH